MPNSRINNSAVSVRRTSDTPNSRTTTLTINVRRQGDTPNVRVSSFQTGFLGQSTSGTAISIGTPIGLLLALTYAVAQAGSTVSPVFRGDYRPNTRIKSE